MTDFCTVQDVEAVLQLTISEIPSAEAAIAGASAAIRGYTGQKLEPLTGQVATLTALPYRQTLVLPQAHVTSVTSVVEDGTTLIVGDDYQWNEAGLLTRVGRYWSTKFRGIVVTYSSGYATNSDEWALLKAVAATAAARRYQMGRRSAVSSGAAGVQSETMPDYSISYGVDLGGSFSMLLLPSEKAVLDRLKVTR